MEGLVSSQASVARGDAGDDASPVAKRARNGASGSRSTRWCWTFNDRVSARDSGRAGGGSSAGDAKSEAEEEEGAESGPEEAADAEAGGGRVAGVSLQLSQESG